MDTTMYPFRIEKFSFLSAKLYTISPTFNQISLFPPRLSSWEEYGKLNLSFYSTLFTYTTLLFFLIDCQFPQVSRARSTRRKRAMVELGVLIIISTKRAPILLYENSRPKSYQNFFPWPVSMVLLVALIFLSTCLCSQMVKKIKLTDALNDYDQESFFLFLI